MSDAIDSLVHFFNDFVGAVIPGIILFFGLAYELGGKEQVGSLFDLFKAEYGWIVLLSVAFAAGHILLALHSLMFARRLKKNRKKAEDTIKSSDAYRGLVAIVIKWRNDNPSGTKIEHAQESSLNFNDLRSIAMSLSSDAAQLGRRFMFIALFCYGIVMAGITIVIAGLWYHRADFLSIEGFLSLAIAIFVLVVTYRRGEEFERRALIVPFPCAAAEFIVPHQNIGAKN